MHIELIGCTSAGKSTLAGRFLQACRDRGIETMLADEFILKQVRLNWVTSHLARTLLVELCSLVAYLLTWRRNRSFYAFSIRLILRLPVEVPWSQKLNLARNVLRKVGIFEIIRRRHPRRSFVLVDEGTLQASHNLFVHVSRQLEGDDLSTFARIVPLPDVAIYVTQPESVLIERTMRRGHKRIPDRSYASVARFIRRAVETFDILVSLLVLDKMMLDVDHGSNIFVKRDLLDEPLLASVLEAVRVGMATLAANDADSLARHPEISRLPDGAGTDVVRGS